MAGAVVAGAALETAGCCTVEARIVACAITVERSDPPRANVEVFFAGVACGLESFSVSVGIVVESEGEVFAVENCRAVESCAAAWTIMDERLDPVEKVGDAALGGTSVEVVVFSGTVVGMLTGVGSGTLVRDSSAKAEAEDEVVVVGGAWTF